MLVPDDPDDHRQDEAIGRQTPPEKRTQPRRADKTKSMTSHTFDARSPIATTSRRKNEPNRPSCTPKRANVPQPSGHGSTRTDPAVQSEPSRDPEIALLH